MIDNIVNRKLGIGVQRIEYAPKYPDNGVYSIRVKTSYETGFVKVLRIF